MRREYKQWVEDAINNNGCTRESSWVEIIAVGNRPFVEVAKVKLGLKAYRLKVIESNDKFVLKEQYVPYNAHFDTGKNK